MILRDLNRLLAELARVSPDAEVLLTADGTNVIECLSVRVVEVDGVPIVILTPTPADAG